MNKNFILLIVFGVALSACGYNYSSFQSGYYDVDRSIPVERMTPDVNLTDVRNVYRDSNVEIFDINQYPSSYTSQRQFARPQLAYALNTRIPVKDKSVEIYDLGFAPLSNPSHQSPQNLNIPLSPPSDAKEEFQSPFLVIEEDGMLTDPMYGDGSHTSVIVPPSENQSQEDDFELMTGF